MYQSFYGFAKSPFQLTPDPDFYFASGSHHKAMAYLQYGLNRKEGFVVVTGDAGSGKTTLVRRLLAGLDPSQVAAAMLVSSRLGAEDVLRAVASAFGVAENRDGKPGLLFAIEVFLTSAAHAGKRCLLVVDEAQNLPAEAIEELRMLANFQLGQHALLQTVLVGHTDFRRILQKAGTRLLRQRLIAACHIGPLDLEEARRYIEHRLECAGLQGGLEIKDDACRAISQASKGVPLRINSICDRLLLAGFLAEQRTFAERDVARVVAEFEQELNGPAREAEQSEGPRDDPASDLSRLELRVQGLERSFLECAVHSGAAIPSQPAPLEEARAGEVREVDFTDLRKFSDWPEHLK